MTSISRDQSVDVRTLNKCSASSDCENPDALMAIAETRVTRELTPSEKLTCLRTERDERPRPW